MTYGKANHGAIRQQRQAKARMQFVYPTGKLVGQPTPDMNDDGDPIAQQDYLDAKAAWFASLPRAMQTAVAIYADGGK